MGGTLKKGFNISHVIINTQQTIQVLVTIVDNLFKLQDARSIFIEPFSSRLKDKSELVTRNKVTVTVTDNVAVISTYVGSTAYAAIVPTYYGHMYVRLQIIVCTCVCPFSVSTSPNIHASEMEKKHLNLNKIQKLVVEMWGMMVL